jgi:SAM-dependent methyltransferase
VSRVRRISFPSDFIDCVIGNGEFSTAPRFRHFLEFTLGDLDLPGSTLLDIGAGNGLLSLAASSLGASVTALEPVGDGSESNCLHAFKRLEKCARAGERVTLINLTVQDYLKATGGEPVRFDIALMADSINHLDEEAVVGVHHDSGARKRFIDLLTAVGARIRIGGSLVILDCARSNFFGRLGITNPLAPSINWNIHQDPDVWCGVLEDSGFGIRSVEWSSPNVLGTPGQLTLGNRWAAWFLRSHFRIHAIRTL